MAVKTKPMPTTSASDVDLIVHASHWNPFSILGLHELSGEGHKGKSWVVRAFLPEARAAWVVDLSRGEPGKPVPMEQIHPDGLFVAEFSDRPSAFPYRLRVENHEGHSWEFVDPYPLGPVLTDFDLHLLGEGTHYRNYERLGAHIRDHEGFRGVHFAVWAPNAAAGQRRRQLQPLGRPAPSDAKPGLQRHLGDLHPRPRPGRGLQVRDQEPAQRLPGREVRPLRLRSRAPPQDGLDRLGHQAASAGTTRTGWRDRPSAQGLDQPIAVYEVHLGSWKRKPEDGGGFLAYRELAEQLVTHLDHTHFTHIELLPITEHPVRRELGLPAGRLLRRPPRGTARRTTSPTSSTTCTATAIGVLLDWVPAHFPSDVHGLGYFDGTHLYEHSDPRLGEHRDWGTKIFNYGRPEVRNFLLGNALFWLDRYHLDGLRVDAVASMLYLDYSRKAGRVGPQHLRRQREPRGDRLPQEAQRALPPASIPAS